MTERRIDSLLNAMWEDYLTLNPDARRIHDLFAGLNNGVVINDHIALRTFNNDKVCLDKIARPFLEAGYQPKGDYRFDTKKLVAKHFEHEDPELPKVFISELLVEELSEEAQAIINSLVDQVDARDLGKDIFCYSGRHWDIPFATYSQLLGESEYAAWMSAFGYRPNHFTVSVNHLQSHDCLEALNQLLLDEGFSLNDSGGLIKGSPDVFLEQSSTMANRIAVDFSDRTVEIPSCFYEFALRYPLPDGTLYQGFVAASADKIFESTNVTGR
ncbi:DUF1338 domain-containing protein [Kistimonas scapharcae]|uniref:2-oxoadipate dioxygenase/decarboxylase n=1 Tax=Kistimonas scapharcae TaxID=1036133 RepID=A0ABP8V065_9GAMM